jgi:hypothetical protein
MLDEGCDLGPAGERALAIHEPTNRTDGADGQRQRDGGANGGIAATTAPLAPAADEQRHEQHDVELREMSRR